MPFELTLVHVGHPLVGWKSFGVATDECPKELVQMYQEDVCVTRHGRSGKIRRAVQKVDRRGHPTAVGRSRRSIEETGQIATRGKDTIHVQCFVAQHGQIDERRNQFELIVSRVVDEQGRGVLGAQRLRGSQKR